MSSVNRSLSQLSIAALASLMLFAFGVSMGAQTTAVGNVQVKGLPDDWTHHHLVFSNPGTEEDAIKNGQHDHWLKVVNNPRYVIQQLKKGSATQGPAGPEVFRIQGIRGDDWRRGIGTGAKTTKIEKDWSVSLGSGTAAKTTGTFTGAATATQTIKINGLTLTSATGATGTILLRNDGTNIAGDTVTVGSVVYQYEATGTGCAANTICVYDSFQTAGAAQSLEAAINGNSGQCPSVFGGTWGATCYTVGTGAVTPNPATTATFTGSTVTVTNPSSTTLALSATQTGADFTLTPATGGVVQANCTSATAGTLVINTSSTTQQAANLAAVINACNTAFPAVGATATSSGAVVTATAVTPGTVGNSIVSTETETNFSWGGATLSGGANATVQPNAYPAKYGVSLTAASCSDFAIYPTGQAGSSTAATIISYDELYSGAAPGCGATGTPAVQWAYNTGTGESVTTSPIISQDGTQIAFIESNGTTASLVLIAWAAETGETVSTPLTLTNQLTAGAYQTCTPTPAAPCMYTIAFGNSKDDAISSPFYDYTGDVLYVGDSSGNLHRFTGVFNGAPAEDTTSPWPFALGSNAIASPIWDDTWNALFVGDLGGNLYCVTQTAGACSTATLVGDGWLKASTLTATGGQIADAPLINSSANYVLAFVNTASANEILGFSEQFFVNSPGTVAVGAGATGKYLYAGSFDNVYYDSSNNTGNLYVVGNTTGATTGANLYQVGLSGGNLTGTVTTVVTGLSTIGANPWPSPLTEFCNNGASACGEVAGQSATGCTTNTGSKTVTCTAGTFTTASIGQVVTATDIPTGSTITAVPGAASITVSANATGHVTTGTASVATFTSPGTDYVFFSVNEGKVSGCTATAGNGCILSYNVTSPSAVAIAGTGQNLTTPATNGCWATGGLSIDNSATTTGASQIYFVNLNGAAAGGGANGGTPTSSGCTSGAGPTIDAVQASQANP